MQLCMTLMHSTTTKRVGELMIFHTRSNAWDYYGVGDEFDGGELVFVHPTGGVVRRNGEYFIYPIGAMLDEDIGVDESAATEYVQLKEAADRIRRATEVESAGAKEEAPKRENESATAGAEPDAQQSRGTVTKTQPRPSGHSAERGH